MAVESSVLPFSPRDHDRMRQQMRQSVYLDELAESMYETVAMCDLLGDAPPEWSQLHHAQRADYRADAEVFLNGRIPEKCHEAALRCREQVALSHYDKDFTILSPAEQREVEAIVTTVVKTYAGVLQGLFTPLPPFRAAELEPTEIH